MRKLLHTYLRASTGLCVVLLATGAYGRGFNIPSGDLETALNIYTAQTGVSLTVSDNAVKGVRTKGASGEFSSDEALLHILAGTGFITHRHADGTITVVRDSQSSSETILEKVAAEPVASAPGAALETVTVTSSKIGGDVQNIPIAITALSQEQLTATQTAGGPDLVKQVPNLTFTKTNFTGYSIQIRGIGTQAISVTTDPAVAVAFNDIPFIRNHFFEQEFFDVGQVEVLRGPQGTLYGRNATAGVVNLTSAKPTDQFEAMVSADIGNYGNRRLEGMINVPIVDDRVDLRVAGEWTKRQGYSFNALDDDRIDGRDLWSGRMTLGFKPTEKLQAYLVWEHFSEDDDRMRTAKQLCKTDPTPTEIGGVPLVNAQIAAYSDAPYLTQGCLPTSLYSSDAFEVVNGVSLPYYEPLGNKNVPVWSVFGSFDPYASATQSQNLRVIETTLDPKYKAKNDTIELNADYTINPALTFTSQTGFNQDFLWSTEDYNRFNTTEGAFYYVTPNAGPVTGNNVNGLNIVTADPNGLGHCRVGQDQGAGDSCVGQQINSSCVPQPGAYIDTQRDPAEFGNPQFSCIPDGVYCDPQLGCSDRLVAEDLSDEHA